MFQRRQDTFSNSMKYCRTEPDESGSKALTYLKETLKLCNIEQIPRLKRFQSIESKNKPHVKVAPKVHANTKQPITYSRYRISSKAPIFSNSLQRSSQNSLVEPTLAIQARQSISQATMLDVPIIKIHKQKASYSEVRQSDYYSIFMEKYMTQARRNNSKERSPVIVRQTQMTINNTAIRNYKRKLKNSRRELFGSFDANVNAIRIDNKVEARYCSPRKAIRMHTIE